MKNLLLATAFFGLSAFAVPANAVDSTMVNACATQMVEKSLTDANSANKVCTCLVNEQSKITQAQKDEIDTWVKNGNDVRQNALFQNISAKFKACGKGVKFNRMAK